MTFVLVNRKLFFELQMWVICHGKIKKGFVWFCGIKSIFVDMSISVFPKKKHNCKIYALL